MITYQRTAGTTDVSVVIRIIDSTDGTPETGVVFNTSGIDLEYRREGEASTDITEATLAALTTAHTDGGFLHIGNGYYRLDLPDAACATGVTGVLVHGTVTGMVVIGCYVQLVTYNPFDSVRLGLTALPNAAADAAGGLPISDAGGLDLDAKLANTNEVTAARMGALTDWINGGRLDLILDELTTQGDTNETKLDTIDNLIDTEIAAIQTTVDAIETDTQDIQTKIGTPSDLGGGATVSANLADIEGQTDDIGAAGAGLTAVPWNASWDAEVQSEVQDAIEANNLDHLAGTATAIPAIPAGTYIDQMMDDGTAAYDRTTDSLQAIRDHATTIKTETASILEDTGTTLPATLDTIDNFLDTEVAAILAAVDTEVAAILALLDDARGEPGQGAPPVNPDAMTKIDYLYKAFRNKITQTATELSIYADDASTVDHKSTISDDGTTYTRGEMATGA